MGEHGKWGFLIPVTLAAASLLATSNADAAGLQEQTIARRGADDPMTMRLSVKDELVLRPSASAPAMLGHQSHSSHSSHQSHGSSR